MTELDVVDKLRLRLDILAAQIFAISDSDADVIQCMPDATRMAYIWGLSEGVSDCLELVEKLSQSRTLAVQWMREHPDLVAEAARQH